jgi:hypothetical protein
MKFAPEWIGALALALSAFVVAWVWRHEYREQERDEVEHIREAGL